MRKIVVFDTEGSHANLLPLSFTRPVADFRVGITTLADKWRMLSGCELLYWPVEYLRPRYASGFDPSVLPADTIWVSGNVVADEQTVQALLSLRPGEGWMDCGEPVAYVGGFGGFTASEGELREIPSGVRRIQFVFDIFLMNPALIKEDFRRITAGRKSRPLSSSNRVVGPMTDEEGLPLIFVEEGADVECATLSTREGPVYIGQDAVVMEGVTLRGPIAFCRKSQARLGAKLYSGSTFGPYCKVGGELSNVVMFGYSNKSHEGYLGNAVIGEWCNIGAGTSASNLKNDYSKIRIWNYARHTFMKTDLQFCGLIMGDHSKAGVNCMFNTATVVGVGVNLHGAGFPRVFIPSFSEGSPAGGFKTVPVDKFETIASRVMARRGLLLTEADRLIFEKIYEVASAFKG